MAKKKKSKIVKANQREKRRARYHGGRADYRGGGRVGYEIGGRADEEELMQQFQKTEAGKATGNKTQNSLPCEEF